MNTKNIFQKKKIKRGMEMLVILLFITISTQVHATARAIGRSLLNYLAFDVEGDQQARVTVGARLTINAQSRQVYFRIYIRGADVERRGWEVLNMIKNCSQLKVNYDGSQESNPDGHITVQTFGVSVPFQP